MGRVEYVQRGVWRWVQVEGLVKCCGSEESDTPLVEAMRLLSSSYVEVDSEEEFASSRVKVDRER